MAETMPFELVSPERRLAAGEAEMVTIPGALGDLGAMPGHAPTLTTLRPGLLVVKGGEAAGEYFVTGGFAEVTPESGAAILAEEAVERKALTRDWIDARIEAARAALDAAPEEGRQAAAMRLSDFETAASQLL